MLASPALAQPETGGSQYARVEDAVANAPGFYYFTRSGDPVVAVTAVGAVQARGRYFVSEGTTVADLLALAGGAGVDRSGQATVRVYREGAQALSVPVRQLYGEGADPITLQEGDVVEVVGLTSTVTGFYVHTQPGADPLTVTAAGGFSAPGRYVVDPETTIGDLVALAGGIGAFGVRESEVEVTSTVRLLRGGGVVFEAPLDEVYTRETQVLEEGDVVDLEVVYKRNAPIWRDVLSVVTAALGIAILVDRLTN